MEIRLYQPADVEALTTILHQATPAFVFSSATVQHWIETMPEEAQLQTLVVEEESQVIGGCESFLIHESSRAGGASIGVWVDEAHRGRGLGSRLFSEAESHLQALGAKEIICYAAFEEGECFLRARGFRAGHQERISSVDPRTVDVSARPALEQLLAAQGYRLVRLADVLDRPEQLYRCFTEAGADVPGDYPWDNVKYEDWRRGQFKQPDLTHEGSFVILHGEEPVALAWLSVDRETLRADNAFTGTSRAHRLRGLGRLAKLATIEWAASEGYSEIVTGNDGTNAGMLALNDELGYKPLYWWRSFLRELTPSDD
jgi:GNAT superfamily N-acetyltransferase